MTDGTDPAAALAAWRDGALAEGRLLELLAGSALVVGVTADPTGAPSASGLGREAEMALLTLQVASGARALPVFTGVEALTTWRREARPVRVRGADAFATAVAEGYDAVVVDVGGPVTLTVDGATLAAVGGAARGGAALRPGGALPPPLVRALTALGPEVVEAWSVDTGGRQPGVGLVVAGPVAARTVVDRLAALATPVDVVVLTTEQRDRLIATGARPEVVGAEPAGAGRVDAGLPADGRGPGGAGGPVEDVPPPAGDRRWWRPGGRPSGRRRR